MTAATTQQPAGGVRWFVEGWQPGYGTSFEAPDPGGPAATDDSQDAADLAVELDPAAWQALRQPADVRAPDVVLLVDGVRRIDASLWSDEPDGVSYPAVAASYAAGVVRCDLRRGAATLAGARPERGLFTPNAAATDLTIGQIRYPARRVDHADPATLAQAVQPALAALEIAVSEQARADAGADDELLVVDGPLRGRQLPNTVGYVKSHSRTYLPASLMPVVTGLRPAERSPVFLHGTRWRNYSWYLRLPGPAARPGRGSSGWSADPTSPRRRRSRWPICPWPRCPGSPRRRTRIHGHRRTSCRSPDWNGGFGRCSATPGCCTGR